VVPPHGVGRGRCPANSLLRRDHRPSPGRGPAREFKTTCSGLLGPPRPGPPAQNDTLQSGFYAPSQGTARQSGLSIPHRVGLQHPRYLTAAPGSTVLNRPAPARESKLQARVHRRHSGPARLLQVTTSVRVLRPAPGTARSDRFIGPAPGRPANSALRCAGFYGPQQAGPARELGLLARVHRAYSRPGPLAQVTRLGQGSTPPLQGTAQPARSLGSSTPHRVGLTAAARHSGSSAPHQGRPAVNCASRDTGPINGPGPHDDPDTGAPEPRGCPDIFSHCVAPGSSCLINGTRLMSTPSAFSTGFNGPLKRAGPGGGKYAG